MKYSLALSIALALAAVVALISAPSARAEGPTGEQIYRESCASCHGGDGRSTSMSQYPKIGGQNEAYLVNALKAYRDGRRQGTFASIMAETAKGLSDQDIVNLASYVASLAGP